MEETSENRFVKNGPDKMNSERKALICLYSGTGNTYRVALWIKDKLDKKNYKTSIVFITEPHSDITFSAFDAIYFLFPTHGFMPPWSMIKFLFKICRLKRAVILCATRGAVWTGPFKIPGAAGFAHFMAGLILLVKGFDIRAMFSIDMPANMINFHPSLSKRKIEEIKRASFTSTGKIMDKIISGKRVIYTFNNLYELILSVVLLFLIPSLPFIYLIYGKQAMAKIMFSSNNCTSCGKCSKFCPNNGIEMKSFSGKKYPFWTHRCENCMRCIAFCKFKAVEAGHSWAFLQYLIVSVPVVTGIFYSFFAIEFESFEVILLINTLYFLPALFLSYRIFWYLLRNPLINRFFSVSSLTHYFNKYNEPETLLKDLTGKADKS